MKRSCANCGAPDTWARFRYCQDCWRMVGATVTAFGAAVAAAAAAVIGHALGARLVEWWLR
jgi:uncharacterized protein (DUF697 family)